MELKNYWFVRLTDSIGGWAVFHKNEHNTFPTLKSLGYSTEQEAIDDMNKQVKDENDNT